MGVHKVWFRLGHGPPNVAHETDRLKEFGKLSLLALALAVVLAVSTAACGDGGSGEQATSAISPAAPAP